MRVSKLLLATSELHVCDVTSLHVLLNACTDTLSINATRKLLQAMAAQVQPVTYRAQMSECSRTPTVHVKDLKTLGDTSAIMEFLSAALPAATAVRG